eukprot:gene15599-18821_t
MTRNEILKKTGQIVGVENASLDVEKGEICVLMGLSGSGKSSLLRCINGLNTVSRGKLFVEHEGRQIDIASCTPAELKMMRTQRIAMVFQKFALMPWLTVRENISFGLEMQGRPEKERRKLVDDKLELIVLNPADDYVRTFVAHTNPLNVLCGRSLMRTVDNCTHVNGSISLDPGGDSWLDLAEGNTIKGARQNGSVLNLQNWAPGQSVEGLGRMPTLVDSNIGMREALQIRYQTGNKLV